MTNDRAYSYRHPSPLPNVNVTRRVSGTLHLVTLARVEVLLELTNDRQDLREVGNLAEEHRFAHGVVVASPLVKPLGGGDNP